LYRHIIGVDHGVITGSYTSIVRFQSPSFILLTWAERVNVDNGCVHFIALRLCRKKISTLTITADDKDVLNSIFHKALYANDEADFATTDKEIRLSYRSPFTII